MGPGDLMKASEQDYREIADLEDRVQRFFETMTKREIYAGALKRRILLAPVATAADIAEDEQLKAREYFVRVDHDTLGRTLTLPGPFAKFGGRRSARDAARRNSASTTAKFRAGCWDSTAHAWDACARSARSDRRPIR